MATYNTGDIVSFKYSKASSHDNAPLLLVIAPLWKNRTHGINIHYLSSQERELIYAMVYAPFRKQSDALNRNASFTRLLESGTLETALANSDVFYERFVKLIVRSNAYRTYDPRFISSIKRLDVSDEQNKNLILRQS